MGRSLPIAPASMVEVVRLPSAFTPSVIWVPRDSLFPVMVCSDVKTIGPGSPGSRLGAPIPAASFSAASASAGGLLAETSVPFTVIVLLMAPVEAHPTFPTLPPRLGHRRHYAHWHFPGGLRFRIQEI